MTEIYFEPRVSMVNSKVIDSSNRHIMSGWQYYVIASFVLIIFMCCIRCNNYRESNLVVLSNEQIEIGILPEVGGRIVFLRKPGMKNIFKSDEKLWVNSEKHKPEISAFSPFKAFNGHIVWIGPQSEWWIHQNINKTRRDTEAVWPPDPYLIYGKYKITYQSKSCVKMVGPASPVSGIRIYKEVSINSSGIVVFTATVENIRKDTVRCDIWMNTRLDGFARGYVPLYDNGDVEFVMHENQTRELTPYYIMDGYFTFEPSIPKTPKKEQVQEAHLYPSNDIIAGFNENQMLLIRFIKNKRENIHPEHGAVELYSFINENGNERLLELELHGIYKTLAPREAMSMTETWELFVYNGDNNVKAHIDYLNNILNTE
jgi:hypothetical protein